MGDEKKDVPSMVNVAARVFRISALILGAVIALNLAVAYLQPILPWIVGGIAVVFAVWLVVTAVRWRRSRW